MLARHGGAIVLDKQDLAQPQIIRQAVLKVLESDRFERVLDRKKRKIIFSYAIKAGKLAQMLKEQPVSAKDLVVQHSTFVAKLVFFLLGKLITTSLNPVNFRFGSLDHLEPYGRRLSIFQYYLLDVIATLLSTALLLLAIIFLTIRWIFRKLFRSQKSKTE